MLILVVVAIVALAGTFFSFNISNYYVQEFSERMDGVFGSDFAQLIQSGAEKPEAQSNLQNTLGAYSGRLGLDVYRRGYLLEGRTGRVLYSTEGNTASNIDRTPNIITALAGDIGETVDKNMSYMDYAYPVKVDGRVEYIVYVLDPKEEINNIIGVILGIIMQALMIGLVISIVLGYFLSKTITSPIIDLTRKAEQISRGDFGTRIRIKSEDEIGKLSRTFNTMARTLQNNLKTMSSEKNKLETILLFLSDGVVAFEPNGNAIHVNRTARRMCNIRDAGNLTFAKFVKKIGCDIAVEELIFKENEIVERDVLYKGRNIKALFGTVAAGKDDVFSAVVVVLHDITKQQKLEQSRREFVANVSHELRTPITTVKAYVETILETDGITIDEARGFLDVVSKESDRMSRLVQDLLALSRLDYDKTNIPKEHFDIQRLLGELVERLQIEARARGHRIEYLQEGEIETFYGNRDRLEQVFTNIIVNAIKYTPENGKIVVTSKVKNDELIVSIKDNGIGIPKEDEEHIFDRFYRVDKARSRESGGTGLGLAIAKEIIQAHGGEIAIQSRPDKGTKMVITLPIYN